MKKSITSGREAWSGFGEATLEALKKEGGSAASPRALSRQATASARKRGAGARHSATMKAVRTEGPEGRSEAAKKAARTRRAA